MSYLGNTPTTTAFVTDQFSGTGSQTVYTMSVAPATTSSVLVSVTGVLQDPSTYSVSGTTLTFSAAPPTGTGNISVRYLGIPASGVTTTAYRTVTEFTATAGQTTFSVPSYTVGYIDVYRNGVRLGAADFTATSGTSLVLASAATAGDLVVTESFYVSSVLNAIPATAGAVNSTYITDAAVTQVKLGANVAGNGPAFIAQQASTAYSGTTWTKINYTTLTDTNNNFSSSRFTPSVAGYYQVSMSVQYAVGTEERAISVYKNGTTYQWFADVANAGLYATSGSTLVYMNGTTDYLEGYAWAASGGTLPAQGKFSAFLARAA